MSESTRRAQNAGAAGSDRVVDAEPDLAGAAGTDSGAEAQPERSQPWTGGSTLDPISQIKQERDEFREQALRARAEFANYQKRAKQQADSDRVYAIGSMARDLLDPLDNLDRAVEALRASGALGVTAGLDMVQRQLHEILAKHGIEPIEALGRPFDPNLHEAVLQQPSGDHPEGTVVAELSKGYNIRDRVLRPTKVAVSVKLAAD
jgi:molecular chaperone GrpE